MSNKLSKSFYGKLTVVAMLAPSLSLLALSVALAQSMSDTNDNTDAMGSTLAPAAGSTDSTTTKASAPMPDDSSAGATDKSTTTSTTTTDSASTTDKSTSTGAPATDSASTTDTSTSTGTTATDSASTTTAPASDIPPGVLWTDPKYAVKEMPPARVAVPTSKRPTTGTKTAKPPTTPAAAANLGYDEKAAQSFANSVSMPQYVWTRQDQATKGHKASAVNTTKEMAAYNKTLVEKFVANMTVPNSATLVENSTNQYVYLFSFNIDGKGKISHINPEKAYGQFTAVNLADDNENAAMTASITQALAKCSPVKVPPAGISPWYMLLKYEPNTGKVFVANLNTI